MMKWAQRKTVGFALMCGGTLAAGTCVTDVRDALIGGALDYVAGTATSVLDNWLPFSQLLTPFDWSGGDAEE